MAIDIRQGQLPHIFWIDIDQNGTLTECAVMKQDVNGNLYYFPVNSLDSIDKRRLLRIIRNRNAQSFELWDLMSNITLNNGINALEYFHQLVQVLTPSGVRMSPRQGVMGAQRQGTMDTRPQAQQVSEAAEQQQAQQEAAQPEQQPAQPAPASKKKTAAKKTAAKSE